MDLPWCSCLICWRRLGEGQYSSLGVATKLFPLQSLILNSCSMIVPFFGRGHRTTQSGQCLCWRALITVVWGTWIGWSHSGKEEAFSTVFTAISYIRHLKHSLKLVLLVIPNKQADSIVIFIVVIVILIIFCWFIILWCVNVNYTMSMINYIMLGRGRKT
jgi:hypothetical protein